MSKIVDFDQLYPNRFMKAGEFAGKDVTLKITAVDLEVLEGEKGKKGKGIITFDGTQKQLVLNRTNGECIKAMFGRAVADWIGKRITLYPATITDSFTSEPTLAIRVRGSPDIEADKTFSAKIGRKQVSLKVVRTGKANGKAAPAQPKPETTPSAEPSPDELAEIAAREIAESQGEEAFS